MCDRTSSTGNIQLLIVHNPLRGSLFDSTPLLFCENFPQPHNGGCPVFDTLLRFRFHQGNRVTEAIRERGFVWLFFVPFGLKECFHGLIVLQGYAVVKWLVRFFEENRSLLPAIRCDESKGSPS